MRPGLRKQADDVRRGRRAAMRRCGGEAARGIGGVMGASVSPRTHESKNRRSTVSRSAPTIVPTLRQRRRPSVKRRSVPASMPTRSASMNAANAEPPLEAPTSRNATCIPTATTMYPTSTSHIRCRSIQSGPNRNAQNEKPSRTNAKRSGSARGFELLQRGLMYGVDGHGLPLSVGVSARRPGSSPKAPVSRVSRPGCPWSREFRWPRADRSKSRCAAPAPEP